MASSLEPAASRERVVAAVREQAGWCDRLSSPLYHALLLEIAEDVERGGVCGTILEPRAHERTRSLLPLRFLAGVHKLVLAGHWPELARYYPSAGGTPDLDRACAAFLAGLPERLDVLAIPDNVQTNEVNRCCALLPGFLNVAHQHAGLPLRLLEIGCSAGLNLRWDRYRYKSNRGGWGDPQSPLVFADAFEGDARLDASVEVISRHGCDLSPIDPTTEEGRVTLLSYLWPDQTARIRQIENAIEVSRRVPAILERSGGVEWLEKRLAEPRPGVATVIFHSVVLLYFPTAMRDRIAAIIGEAGERATTDAPVAWLSMEPGSDESDVHLTIWPGAGRCLIATSGYHGRNVKILSQ